MLQLLVFPFSLPSSQMIFFLITVFKNYFFNVEKIWKSYWTALGHSASPSSQWADGWTIHRIKEEAGKIPCAKRSLARPSPGWGCLHSTHSHFTQLAPSSPWPIHGMWAAEKGKAILESGGYRRVLEAEGGGSERLSPQAASSRQPSRRMGKRGCPLRGWSPTHIYCVRPQLSGSPPLSLSLHPSWPQSLRRQWSKTERQRQLAVI